MYHFFKGKFMKTLISLLALLIFPFVLSSQPFISIVSQNGTTIFAPTMDSALTLANNDDIIYVPAGSYDVSNLVINKRVHIIGAGYNYVANGADGTTNWYGSISIESGADGGSLQGIYLLGNIHFGKTSASPVNNYTISRCTFNEFYSGPDYNSHNNYSNLLIAECIVKGRDGINLGYSRNAIIRKCIFYSTYFLEVADGVNVENCIIAGTGSGAGSGLWNVKNSILRNNIIVRKISPVNPSHNEFINNIYCFEEGIPTNGVTRMEGNVYMALESVFVNYDNTDIDFATHNFHLKQEAINKITGTDGTQVGIYGTSDPFKDYGIPVNPHIKKAKVNPMTTPDGKLRIEFEVEAQQK